MVHWHARPKEYAAALAAVAGLVGQRLGPSHVTCRCLDGVARLAGSKLYWSGRPDLYKSNEPRNVLKHLSSAVRETWYRYHLSRTVQGALNCTNFT